MKRDRCKEKIVLCFLMMILILPLTSPLPSNQQANAQVPIDLLQQQQHQQNQFLGPNPEPLPNDGIIMDRQEQHQQQQNQDQLPQQEKLPQAPQSPLQLPKEMQNQQQLMQEQQQLNQREHSSLQLPPGQLRPTEQKQEQSMQNHLSAQKNSQYSNPNSNTHLFQQQPQQQQFLSSQTSSQGNGYFSGKSIEDCYYGTRHITTETIMSGPVNASYNENNGELSLEIDAVGIWQVDYEHSDTDLGGDSYHGPVEADGYDLSIYSSLEYDGNTLEGMIDFVSRGWAVDWIYVLDTSVIKQPEGTIKSAKSIQDECESDTWDITFSDMPLNHRPVANPGTDQTVFPADTVTLNGSGSYDPDGNPISFEWIQTDGPTEVDLINSNTATPSFFVPFGVPSGSIFTFGLVVTDSKGATSIIPKECGEDEECPDDIPTVNIMVISDPCSISHSSSVSNTQQQPTQSATQTTAPSTSTMGISATSCNITITTNPSNGVINPLSSAPFADVVISVKSSNGEPMSNSRVKLQICTALGKMPTTGTNVIPDADGHLHDKRATECSPGRPHGKVSLNINGNLKPIFYSNSDPSITSIKTTDANGKITLKYEPPRSTTGNLVIALEDKIKATLVDDSSAVTVTKSLTTKVTGLRQMYNSDNCQGATAYLFQRQTNHGCVFYGKQIVNDALKRIAYKYFVRQQECINYLSANPPSQSSDPNNPCRIQHEPSPNNFVTYFLHLQGSPIKMEISAMALPWGGLHDIGPNAGCNSCSFWNPSHYAHGDGRNVDIAFGALSPYKDEGHGDDVLKLLRFLIKSDPYFSKFGKIDEGINMSICDTQCTHYHAVFQDVPRSQPEDTARLSLNSISTTGGGKTITISGTLRDASTNSALAGKTVTFDGSSGTTASISATTTAADGTFKTTATTSSSGGKYYIRAQFSDAAYSKATDIKKFTVDTEVPTITLTSPTNGATFTAPATIKITADAKDKLSSASTTFDGKIRNVEFLYKRSTDTTYTLIRTDTVAPYDAQKSSLPAGSYNFIARAYDEAGNRKTSSTVTVNVR